MRPFQVLVIPAHDPVIPAPIRHSRAQSRHSRAQSRHSRARGNPESTKHAFSCQPNHKPAHITATRQTTTARTYPDHPVHPCKSHHSPSFQSRPSQFIFDFYPTYVLTSATSAPNRLFNRRTRRREPSPRRAGERAPFCAFDAAVDTDEERSAGGVNRADVGDLTSRANGEIDCSRTQGDGTRYKPLGFRAKRRPQDRPGREICLGARMRSRSLAPTSKPGVAPQRCGHRPRRGCPFKVRATALPSKPKPSRDVVRGRLQR